MTDEPALQIRRADSSDLPQLADLRWRLKTEDAPGLDPVEQARFQDAFTAGMNEDFDAAAHWVAEVDGQLVGAMSVVTVSKLPAPGAMRAAWGYLTNCYVLPAWRGDGVGAALLAAVRWYAEAEAFELLVVWPSDRAYPFYERAGFQRHRDPLVLQISPEA